MSGSDLSRRSEPFPPTVGWPGVAQGSYGDVGNLELVLADPYDGFWVFWFNADDDAGADERPAGAVRGHWSGGLAVPTGTSLTGVRVAQVPFGPNFLEVSAHSRHLSSAELAGSGRAARHRWFWSPDAGFQPGGALPGVDGPAPIPVLAAAGALHTLGLAGGRLTHHRAAAAQYPRISWKLTRVLVESGVRSADLARHSDRLLVLALADDDSAAIWSDGERGWRARVAAPPGRWRSATLSSAAAGAPLWLTGSSPAGQLQVARYQHGAWQWLEGPTATDSADSTAVTSAKPASVEHVAAALSSLGGGTLEVVVRSSGLLEHRRYPVAEADHPASAPGPATAPLISDVWSALPSGTSVHRR